VKKCILIYLVAFAILTLAACGTTGNVNPVNKTSTDGPLPPAEVEVREGDFVFKLYSEKDIYENGDIAVFAELTYVGDEDSVEIYHAASPFYFPIEERTRGLEFPYGMDQPLIMTTLNKGEPFREEYGFSGGYSDNDTKEYVEFAQKLMEKRFPEGEYIIHGSADFYIENPEDIENQQDYKIRGDIGFKVVR